MSLLWKTAVAQVEAAKPIPSKDENLRSWMYERQGYAGPWRSNRSPLPHEQTLEDFGAARSTFWHGSPNGVAGMKVANNGVHVGTRLAAKQALEARIGRRADGQDWDGTQEYGKTLLAGYDSLRDRGENASGYNCGGPNGDHYPTGRATYGLQDAPIPLNVKPNLFPVKIVGGMTNSSLNPHPDWHANGYMSAQIKQGRARNGYYYRNIGEDSGSISAVVPNADHLATHEDFVRHAWGHPALRDAVHPENVERYGL